MEGWLPTLDFTGRAGKPEKWKMAAIMRAHLPVGPFERQLREGIQGVVWEEVHEGTLKKE